MAEKHLRRFRKSKQVLQQSDFTYLGCCYTYDDGGNATYQRALAHRYPSGNFRLYTWSIWGNNLYEMILATLNSTPSTYCSLANNFGNIFSGKKVHDNPGASSWPYGLYWDAVDERMYWAYQDIYNAIYPEDTCLGYSTLDDESHTGTGIKAVRMPTAVNCKIVCGLVPLPAEFASSINGWRLAVGFGGDKSAHASGPASLGPALVSLNPTDITNTAHQGYLTDYKTMVKHNFNATDRTSPWRARRDEDYRASSAIDGGAWNPNGESYGFWTWLGYIEQGAIWIDTGAKHGFLVMPNLSSRNGATGAYSSTWVTDPAPTTTVGTLTSAIDGLAVGEWVHADGPGQGLLMKIQAINGLQITYSDVYGEPLSAAPYAPGGCFRGDSYVGGGPLSCHMRTWWYMYDPNELKKGALGETAVDLVQPSWTLAVTYPPHSSSILGSYHGPTNSGYYPLVDGVTFDSTTNKLYVMVRENKPVIHVWQVS